MYKLFTNDVTRAILAMLVSWDIMHLFRVPVMAICRENQLLTLTDGCQNHLMTHRFRRGVVVANLKLIGRKRWEEFVFEVFVASMLPFPSSRNHRPSECVTLTQRCSLEYN